MAVIVEALTFDDPVSSPDDGDLANAATFLAEANQGFANRTRNLVNRIGGVSGAGEHLYVNAAGVATVRQRVRIISGMQLSTITAQIASGGNSWAASLGSKLVSIVNYARLTVDLNQVLPDGATITGARVIVAPGANRTAQGALPGDNGRMFTRLLRGTPDFATPAATAFGADIAAKEDAGGTGVQIILNPAFSAVIDKSASFLLWQLISGDTSAASPDDVHAVEFTYDDPGPQNF